MFSNIPSQQAGEMPIQPDLTHTTYLSGKEAIDTVAGAVSAIPGVTDEYHRQRISESLDSIHDTLNDPRLSGTQQAFDTVANLATYGIATAPLAIAGGEITGALLGRAALSMSPLLPDAVVSLARTPISKIATSSLSDWLPEATVGQGVKGTVSSYMAYKAAVFPQHLMENYDALSDTYNFKKAASQTVSDNMGFLIGAVPFAAGYIGYKALRIRGSNLEAKATAETLKKNILNERELKKNAIDEAMQNAKNITEEESNNLALATKHAEREQDTFKAIDDAVEKGLMPESHRDWYRDYIKDPDNVDLHPKALEILKNESIPMDRVTGRIWSKFLEPDDISKLKQVLADEVTSNVSEDNRKALSQYIIHNRMDALKQMMIENPSMKDGLQGYIDYVNKKMLKKSDVLESLDNHLDKHLSRGLKKKEMLSQSNIYNHLKRKGVFDVTGSPYHVPSNVAYKLKLRGKLEDLQKGKTERYRKWFKEAAVTQLKKEINDVKLLTPKEELEYLRNKFIPKNNNLNKYYRGRSSNTFGFKTLEEAGVTEKSLMKNDLWLGKGYWYAENEQHARKYGNVIEKVSGKYKIFDVEKSKDENLLKLYRNIINSERINLIPDETGINNKVSEFRKELQKKGYEGVRRFGIVGKDAAEYEIMFFEKPKEKVNLINDFQNKPEYHRLSDLAEVLPNAEMLLKRLHDEHEYLKQEAYSNFIKSFMDFVDSNVEKLARSDRVIKYMKERVEENTPNINPEEPTEAMKVETRENIKNTNKLLSNKNTSEEIINDQKVASEKSNSKTQSIEFDQETKRYEQFKENESALEEMINCAEEILNA